MFDFLEEIWHKAKYILVSTLVLAIGVGIGSLLRKYFPNIYEGIGWIIGAVLVISLGIIKKKMD